MARVSFTLPFTPLLAFHHTPHSAICTEACCARPRIIHVRVGNRSLSTKPAQRLQSTGAPAQPLAAASPTSLESTQKARSSAVIRGGPQDGLNAFRTTISARTSGAACQQHISCLYIQPFAGLHSKLDQTACTQGDGRATHLSGRRWASCGRAAGRPGQCPAARSSCPRGTRRSCQQHQAHLDGGEHSVFQCGQPSDCIDGGFLGQHSRCHVGLDISRVNSGHIDIFVLELLHAQQHTSWV